jgi:hypothetical protein
MALVIVTRMRFLDGPQKVANILIARDLADLP